MFDLRKETFHQPIPSTIMDLLRDRIVGSWAGSKIKILARLILVVVT